MIYIVYLLCWGLNCDPVNSVHLKQSCVVNCGKYECGLWLACSDFERVVGFFRVYILPCLCPRVTDSVFEISCEAME